MWKAATALLEPWKWWKPKITQIKVEEIVEEEEEEERERGEDRISNLPEHLILDILSRLPSIKDAIKTGTLAKRWENVWTRLPTLIFDNNASKLPLSDFVSLVSKTLTQCRPLKLKKFQVCTHYDSHFESQVGDWIHYALDHNVEELKLGFQLPSCESGFVLDKKLLSGSCFTDLTLKGCRLDPQVLTLEGWILNPIGAISWKNLRSLCITGMIFNKDLMENIFSGSPLLETLVLDSTIYNTRLDVTSSKSLKNLVLSGFIHMSSVDIEIYAPHILSLTIKGILWNRKLLLVNVSSLVLANLECTHLGFLETTPEFPTHEEIGDEMLKGLILNLLHVKELKIGVSSSKAVSRLQAKGFIIPSNLKCCGVTLD